MMEGGEYIKYYLVIYSWSFLEGAFEAFVILGSIFYFPPHVILFKKIEKENRKYEGEMSLH